MLYLAKILPAFLLPTGVIIVLLVLSAALRRRALALAALALLWLSSTSLVSDTLMRAAEGWQIREPLASAPQADAIVVLSGVLRIVPGREPTAEWSEAVDRMDAGVALARADKAPLLVFTSEWFPWNAGGMDKGQWLADRAVELGVARTRIVITRRVSNTADEARAVSEVLTADRRPHATVSVILVTSAFHMRRSELLFTRAGLSVRPYPVDFRTSAAPRTFMDLLPGAGGLYNTETALRELYGYLYYRFVKTG
jgi:uncharacterized SAM-binding protein YcdF (DUF218 family)